MNSELLFDLSLNLDRAHTQDVGAGPQGHCRIVPELGGSFAGPKLKGEVLPGGAEWLLLRPDGVKQMDVRITLRTNDGELIYTTYRGVDTASPEVAERLARSETVDPSEYYFRIQPLLETGSQKYGWMNQIVSVGFGKRTSLSLGYARLYRSLTAPTFRSEHADESA
jgi:Protein of unknown function (DUF3237)